MYIPEHFAMTDADEVFAFVSANAFGQLISQVDGRLFSSHIPFLVSDDRKHLLAHVARANPQWRNLEGQEVLATFQGPHDYVSPSWYQTPGLPPTWNYQAAHIYGRCRLIEDPEQLKSIIDRLTDQYESSFEQPWVPDYKSSMLRGIIGLELTITDLQAKYKLSQNRSDEDRSGVIEQLEARGAEALASAMQKT
ncbi:MAG: FMN-binding negative transcriptional regulator [Pseudomonadota bacterium]